MPISKPVELVETKFEHLLVNFLRLLPFGVPFILKSVWPKTFWHFLGRILGDYCHDFSTIFSRFKAIEAIWT